MSYCEICKRDFTKPSTATSVSHLNSKDHKKNLAKRQIQQTINPIYELMLFTLFQRQQETTYSKILKFYSSFGIKTELAFKTILKKLNDGDIIYKGNTDSDYMNLLQSILKSTEIKYPLTLSVQEAIKKFKYLNIKYPSELIKYFEELSQRFPEFISLSSSKIGEPSDLITFKQVFIDQIKFYPDNNWVLE